MYMFPVFSMYNGLFLLLEIPINIEILQIVGLEQTKGAISIFSNIVQESIFEFLILIWDILILCNLYNMIM